MTRVAAWLAWFAGLLLFWLALVGTVEYVEWIAGLCAAALGATAVDVVRSQGLLRFRVQCRWLRRLWRPLLRVVPDFLLVLAALARRSRGRVRTVDFPTGGHRDVDVGRRAFVTLAASLAPNSLVIDVDAESGEVLVHDLVPTAAPKDLP
jgi:multisubunit Na+/H+ antiporter MnhE subunit